LAEGLGSLEGKKLCLIEDVITTGGQVIESAEKLRSSGAQILGVICAILRGTGDELKNHELPLFSIFTMEELKRFGIKTTK
jgi:orotate phosphoribosyltransferase